jgi:hypothetical protein
MSSPGPNAMQFIAFPLHVEELKSQGKPSIHIGSKFSEQTDSAVKKCRHRETGAPVSMHIAPFVFGETSPRFVAANAATKSPFPGRVSLPLKCFSIK